MSDELDHVAAVAADTGSDHDFERLLVACRAMIRTHVRRIGFRNAILGVEDLWQIACIAIREALKKWKPALSAFGSFAGRVIRCRLLNAVDSQAWRPAFQSLDGVVASSTNDDDDEPLRLRDVVIDRSPSPAVVMEQRDTIAAVLRTLSPPERTIIFGVADGRGYKEIGDALGLAPKDVDNAVQRIRRRARETFLAAA